MPGTERPFERAHPNAYEWTDKAYDFLIAKRLDCHVHRRDGLQTSAVVGACPRCEHTFRFDSSPDAITTGGRTLGQGDPAPDPDDYVPVDVRCTCTGEHAGRQPGETGCGITFRIEVRAEDHDD